MTRHTSGPSSAMRSSRSSSGRSSGGASVGRRTARGFGSNVTATGRTQSAAPARPPCGSRPGGPGGCRRTSPGPPRWAARQEDTGRGPGRSAWKRRSGPQPVRRQLADPTKLAPAYSRHGPSEADGARRAPARTAERSGRWLSRRPPSGDRRRRRQVGDGAVGGQDRGSPSVGDVARLDRPPTARRPSRRSGPTRVRVERLDVAPAPERLAEVGGKAADVRARPARHADAEARGRALEELEARGCAPGGARARPRCRPAPARGGVVPPAWSAEYMGGTCSISPTNRCERRLRTSPARAAERAARPSRRRSRRGCPSPRRGGRSPDTPCPGPGDTRSAWSPRRGGSGGGRWPWDRACPRGRPWARGASAGDARPPGTT